MRDLDQAIIRVAVANARVLIAQGASLSEAVELSTPGAWAEYRPGVLKRVQDAVDRPCAPATAMRG